MDDFAERLRHFDGVADELNWPPSLPRHRLACDVLERALRLGGASECLEAVIAIRASLNDAAALSAIATRMWDRVPHRGLYPNVSGEPSWESLPAWAAATLADPRFYSDVFSDALRIASHAAAAAGRDAVLAAAREVMLGARPGPQDHAAIAWQAAIDLPLTCGILPHPADAVRVEAFGPPESDWEKLLEYHAWEAERMWQNHWLASII